MELKKRKLPRLKNYDYSENGAYFITFCVKNMRCVLSTIVGSGIPDAPKNVGRGILDAPKIDLTDYGKIVENQIYEMNKRYHHIRVDDYVIMPNHVHLIAVVSGNTPSGASWTPLPTNSAVSSYVGTLKRFCNKRIGESIWQTGYYDHIIRDEADYISHLQYIEENPKKWLLGKDEYYA